MAGSGQVTVQYEIVVRFRGGRAQLEQAGRDAGSGSGKGMVSNRGAEWV